MSAEPGTSWEDHLTGTLIAIRMFPTKAHGYSPFEIVYKQEPALPSLIVPPEPSTLQSFWAKDQDEEKLAFELTLLWMEVHPAVTARLPWTDARAKAKYEEAQLLEMGGVPHQFNTGDSVLLMQRRIGNLLPKATGPWIFLRY